MAPTVSPIQTLMHFIARQSLPASDGGVFEVMSPVTEQVIATSAKGTLAGVNAAVAAARAQFDGGAWSQLTGAQRGVLINKLADLVARDSELLANMDAGCIGRVPIEPRLLDLPNAIALVPLGRLGRPDRGSYYSHRWLHEPTEFLVLLEGLPETIWIVVFIRVLPCRPWQKTQSVALSVSPDALPRRNR